MLVAVRSPRIGKDILGLPTATMMVSGIAFFFDADFVAGLEGFAYIMIFFHLSSLVAKKVIAPPMADAIDIPTQRPPLLWFAISRSVFTSFDN
jgi:hypothetical protein